MPPKKSGKGDRNKQKQEEAERQAREEEEKRLKEEEEKRQREEQEQRDREEREKREAEEREILELERKEFKEKRDNITGIVHDHLIKKKEEHEWHHYTSCSSLPLVSDIRALNTFISIFREQPHPIGLSNSLDRLIDIYQLISQTIEDEGGITLSPKLKQLTDVVNEALNTITLSLMENPNNSIDPETFNLIAEGQVKGYIEYCLWGNVVKNPRLKNFTFKAREFNLELPKAMLLADVAIRVIYSSLDFLSPSSKSYHYFAHPATPLPPPSTTENGIVVNITDEEEIEGKGTGGDIITSEQQDTSNVANSIKTPALSSRASTAAKSEDERKLETPNKEQQGNSSTNEDNVQDLDKSQDKEEVEEQLDEGGTKEEEELEDDEVDLRCYQPSGGIIYLDLYTLPPLSKTVQEWTLKQVIVDGLKHSPHPTDPSGTIVPVNITMSLPEHYFYLDKEAMQLAIWDEEKSIWRTSNKLIRDVDFDLEQRTVTFKLLQFAPLAIMSEKYVNFPYQSWDIVPVGVNHNYIHIVGGCGIEVTISVERDCCTVIRPTEDSILANMINVPMTVDELIQALKNIGYNFFPEPDMGKYASRTTKSEAIEVAVYENMAMCCNGWGFQWSKFNGECDSDRVIVSCTQCTSDQWKSMEREYPDFNEMNWIQIICSNTKAQEVDPSQGGGSDKFCDDMIKLNTSHLNLHNVLMKQCIGQTTGADPIHVYTMERLLKATRPLTST